VGPCWWLLPSGAAAAKAVLAKGDLRARQGCVLAVENLSKRRAKLKLQTQLSGIFCITLPLKQTKQATHTEISALFPAESGENQVPNCLFSS